MKVRKLLSLVLVAVMLLGCMTVTAFADDTSATLDLESSATYADKTDIDQNYTFTQDGDTSYTDVTKVKLNWTITDIAATYASNKTWDPDTLSWKETKTVADIADKTAEFTLTNYSSKKVIGTVSFEAETDLKDTLTSATFDVNNGKEIDTVVNSDHTIDAAKKASVPSNTITATLVFNKDGFADLTATTSAAKYGTYTVTISEAPTVTWSPLSMEITTATSEKLTVNYLPVFADNAVPENITFAYKDGEAYTTIENPTMSSLAIYANAGTLYYKGTGTLVTVRSVNDISWNDTFKSDSASSYPYYASTAYADLQAGIKAKIANDGSETVEKLAMETSGDPSQTPTINDVSIGDICNVYKDEDGAFGGDYGDFWSCVAESSSSAYYDSNIVEEDWESTEIAEQYGKCVLISRTFN